MIYSIDSKVKYLDKDFLNIAVNENKLVGLTKKPLNAKVHKQYMNYR